MNLQVNQTEQIELKITAVINNSKVLDFDKDRYYLQGIDFSRYNLNPVLCLNHEYNKLPIGTVNNLRIENGELILVLITANHGAVIAHGQPRNLQFQIALI